MADPFVAEIRIMPTSFAPKGWAFCDGQLLPISQNTALFSLVGTFYGGDGKSTFALPDLRGSAPLHHGQGPGLTERFIGEQGGTTVVTLLQSEIPAHSHTVQASQGNGFLELPGQHAWASSEGGRTYRNASNVTMGPNALAFAGSSLPHNNMQPYLVLHFFIALQGVFPPRS